MYLALVSSVDQLDFGRILLDLAIVLVVAKVAAELAERVRVPAVLGEIIAGIVVGPSVLGLVNPSDALKVLAELGVIVLLVQVGLEMDLVELRRVGRASLSVAVIGVVVPMGAGVLAGHALGETMNASLFLGAALAATSVGITARVFGDLRALSSTEARIVLGAAVADDVLGLIILTVVTRVVKDGSVDIASVFGTVVLAVAFLTVSGIVGMFIIPRIFGAIDSRAASPATIGVLAGAAAFGFAATADAAHLAPIIGAFMAGIALGKVPQRDRVAREFSVLGNLLIPIFFLQIGIDTDAAKFFQAHVLWLALVLIAIAIASKIVAAIGAVGTTADKLIIGIGMIPRGEVGLIFATIGLQIGVFDEDLYVVVLLVVLVTTVITPPLLRWRLGSTTSAPSVLLSETPEPPTGWLQKINGEVLLTGVPPSSLVLQLSLQASLLAIDAKPGDALLDWSNSYRDTPLVWDTACTTEFLLLLANGNSRSWRFLDIVAVMDRALPELAQAVHKRNIDASELDPTHSVLLPTVESMRDQATNPTPENCSLILAAFLADLSAGDVDGTPLLSRLVLSDNTRRDVRALLNASTLLRAACSVEIYEPNHRVLNQLADYLGSPMNVELCRQLTVARGELEDWQYSLLLDITSGVQEVLAHPELIEGREGSIEAVRRNAAIALADNDLVRERITHASASYILAHDADVIVRHAILVEPAPRKRTVRVSVAPTAHVNEWIIDIATRDMNGLLSRIAGVLADNGLEVMSADLATWPDGAVVDTFTVQSPQRPSARMLSFEIEQSLRGRVGAPRRLQIGISKGLTLDFDQHAHPWHSVVTVSGSDQHGLLQSLAAAFARAGVSVHHATISTDNGIVTDKFEVSDRFGRKVRESAIQKVEQSLR